MFKLSLKEEDILMQITVTKPISNKDVVLNFVGNILTPAGGDIANKINMILTKDSVYLEAKGHGALGYAEETRSIDKIALKDIKEFIITPKDNEELITIITVKDKLSFVRDNSDNNGFALALSLLIKDIK